MGWRGTAALLVALGIAAFLLYRDANAGRSARSWRAVFEETRETPPADQVTPLLAFDPKAVTALTLRQDGRQWRAERTADGWSGAGRATDTDEFLRDLQELAVILPIDVGPDTLREHGLAPPQASVELTRSAGPPITLLIGDRNPPGTGVYVRVGSEGPVVLTGALLLWDLEKFARAFGPPA